MVRILALCTALCPSLANSQPFSESMMDCAALYQNAAQFVETPESADRLRERSRIWASHALAQTAREGLPLSFPALMQRIDDKTSEWEAKSPSVFLKEEFRDWTAYCKAFGRSQGIKSNP